MTGYILTPAYVFRTRTETNFVLRRHIAPPHTFYEMMAIPRNSISSSEPKVVPLDTVSLCTDGTGYGQHGERSFASTVGSYVERDVYFLTPGSTPGPGSAYLGPTITLPPISDAIETVASGERAVSRTSSHPEDRVLSQNQNIVLDLGVANPYVAEWIGQRFNSYAKGDQGKGKGQGRAWRQWVTDNPAVPIICVANLLPTACCLCVKCFRDRAKAKLAKSKGDKLV